ncbi:hypothetical protein B0F87_11163 [Methylobacter tundripaludum]|uniref:Uncharacterized protein n=1 Tax=Methylobacter tundripaludum TaxID=173365 RepID=A0A2S6H9F9_9GAMM|nr:hypothetical protein B0F87_11163 [Methylobacter tundripaludum]
MLKMFIPVSCIDISNPNNIIFTYIVSIWHFNHHQMSAHIVIHLRHKLDLINTLNQSKVNYLEFLWLSCHRG